MADELRARGRHRPGESVRGLAERLGFRVVERNLPPAVAGWALRDSGVIIMRPTGYAPRDEFTIAHELIELVAPRPWLDLPIKERMCDRGAAALLLPAGAFRASVAIFGPNPEALRRRWALASLKTIAKRLIDVGLEP